MNSREYTIKTVLRPLKLSIILSVVGELIIFIVWGLVLYPEGSVLHKFLWAVVFCGFGMGSLTGAMITLFVVQRLKGMTAIAACVVISGLLLGVFCNFLCLNLDMHFNYFGGHDTPGLFIWSGLLMSIIGGLLVGVLSFTETGEVWMSRFNI